MSITVPPRLEEKLSENEGRHAGVHSTLAEFATWMSNSGTPLFPEYTDHGPPHVEKVLATASSLIRDKAWPAVTPTDAALLILATLLHDSAMHLSEDGFLELVDSAANRRRIPAFDEGEWPSLWATFLHRARRWDGKQRIAVFGEDGEGAEIKRQLPPKGEMTRHDRMLYGEFIRRHHGRFAHEAAFFGVPGPGTPPLHVSDDLAEDVRDLAGLLARSHSLPVREIIPYLNERYRTVEYKGSHPVFLATLIRTGDYLEICPERAPEAVLKVARLLSPVSRREWESNQAVADVSTQENDPELVYVTARPRDVRTYLKIRAWLDGLQAELDASWAVLGEVYGRQPGFEGLGLAIRRVQSNLDDVEAFAGQVNYVPRKVRLEVARSEVLPLLVGPLYDNSPVVGVRELMQNALDAVRELRDYLATRSEHPAPDTYDHEGDVEIWIGKRGEDRGLYVTVTDKGIGMTEEVVREYFLTAGATYRDSDEWKDMHERPDVEGETTDEPVSRVLRSGRFGVGVLAAFLLGEEITVTTRHIEAPAGKAIQFILRPDDDLVELTYCSAPVGTRIRVRANPRTVAGLTADDERLGEQALERIYLLRDPSVAFRFGDRGERREQVEDHCFPGEGAGLPRGWHRFKAPGFADVQWCAHRPPRCNSPVVCNGIPIGNDRGLVESGITALGRTIVLCDTFVHAPVTSVFDPDGRLPLNLKRDGIASPPAFDDALRRDVLRWLCAWMLVKGPDLAAPLDLLHEAGDEHRSWDSGSGGPLHVSTWRLLVATTQGLTLSPLLPLVEPPVRTVCAVQAQRGHDAAPSDASSGHRVAFVRPPDALANSGWFMSAAGICALSATLFLNDTGLSGAGGRLLSSDAQCGQLAQSLQEELAEGVSARALLAVPRPISMPTDWEWAQKRYAITDADGDTAWVRIESPDCPPTLLDLPEEGLKGGLFHGSVPIVGILEVFTESGMPQVPEHELVREVWMEVFDGCPVIPFPMEERRTKLAAAWEKLEPYMPSVEHMFEMERRRMGRVETGDE